MTEFSEKLKSISFGTVPGGTRNQRVTDIDKTEAQWDKDFPAYKRLRKEGLQPARSDGAAEIEKRAETREDVERL